MAAPTQPDATPQTLWFEDDGTVPNNPDLPAVLIRGAVDPGTGDAAIRALYEKNGWHRTWTYTVYDFEHYHPDAHEVLTVASGRAKLQIGGPSGTTLDVAAGDAMILPAGTGHRRLSESEDFAVCGGYPSDQPAGTIVRAPQERAADHVRQIAALSRPSTDPLFGAEGPLSRLWSA